MNQTNHLKIVYKKKKVQDLMRDRTTIPLTAVNIFKNIYVF